MQTLRCATIVLLLVTMGCYKYVPASAVSGPSVGRDVRVLVTEEEAERLQLSDILPASPRIVTGTLLSSGESQVEVQVLVRDRAQREFRERDLHQRFAVRRDGIEDLDFKALDKIRTVFTVAVAGVLMSLFIGEVTGFLGGDTEPGPPEPLGKR